MVAALIGLAACSSSGITTTPGATSKSDFCKLVVAFKAADDSLGTNLTTGSPAQIKAAMRQIIGQVETLQQRAPASVKADVDTAAAFINQFDALLSKYDYDFKSIEGDAAVAAEFQALNNDQVNASLARLGTFSTSECGVPSTSTSAP
jgi:hypothetical protein